MNVMGIMFCPSIIISTLKNCVHIPLGIVHASEGPHCTYGQKHCYYNSIWTVIHFFAFDLHPCDGFAQQNDVTPIWCWFFSLFTLAPWLQFLKEPHLLCWICFHMDTLLLLQLKKQWNAEYKCEQRLRNLHSFEGLGFILIKTKTI